MPAASRRPQGQHAAVADIWLTRRASASHSLAAILELIVSSVPSTLHPGVLHVSADFSCSAANAAGTLRVLGPEAELFSLKEPPPY